MQRFDHGYPVIEIINSTSFRTSNFGVIASIRLGKGKLKTKIGAINKKLSKGDANSNSIA